MLSCLRQTLDNETSSVGFLKMLLTRIFKVETLQHILMRYDDTADELLLRSEKNADKLDSVL